MIDIDRYAYANSLAKVNPYEKFIFAIVTMLICLFSWSIIIPVSIVFLMAVLIIGWAKIPAKLYIHLIFLPVSFIIMGALTITLSVQSSSQGLFLDVNLFGFYIGMRLQDIALAGHIIFKSLGAVSCLYFLSLTTPMVDVFTVLRRIKVPSIFVELMSLMYRFIFVLMETATVIKTSQSSRLGYSSFKTSLRSLSQLFSTLFVRALHRSNVLSLALMSRCYTGEIRVLEMKYTFSKKNILVICLFDSFLLLLNLLLRGDYFV